MRDTVLTTTITKDLLQIVVAAMLFAAGAAVVVTDGDAAGAAGIASLLWHLLGSLGIGVAIGFASAWLVDHAGDRIGLVTAGMGVAVAAIAEVCGVSPLLTGLAAGLVLANLWPERTARMFRTMQDVFLPVSVIFFANAGASIDLVQLASVWPLALGLVTIRLVLMRSAVTAGMRWAKVPEPAAGLAWTGFIAQAGVSLALAREFESAFAGSSFTGVVTTLLVAMIAFHEAIGPPIFAWGLRRSGEVPRDDA
jgi:Kef-type K+ transport system membrane component KefB